MSILTKDKRVIYSRKIKGFWEEFRNNRIGFVGLIILITYVLVAFLCPFMTPYSVSIPETVAAPFAMPQWVTIFPQYKEYPPTIPFSIQSMDILQNSSFVNITLDDENNLILTYNSDTHQKSADILLYTDFDYQYIPPGEFKFVMECKSELTPAMSVTYTFELILENKANNTGWKNVLVNSTHASLFGKTMNRRTLGSRWIIHTPMESLRKRLFGTGRPTRPCSVTTPPNTAQGYESDPEDYLIYNPAKVLFSKKGEYGLLFKITFKPKKENATCKITLNGNFEILGSVHGVLGTNKVREDIFTELIYGARISLVVGGLAAIIATTLGILFGVISGYFGGMTDELIMRMVDVLLCLPLLPILLILIGYFRPNVYYIVVLIAIFGWQGLSRIIRSRVLSLREMPFIESARAAGASNLYLITHHLIPNIIPVAMASMILAVPAAILTEAALSFLGFGDPNVPTWGRMLNNAHNTGAFSHLVWWYWIPPGIAITVLCLAFVFIGHALDQIVNPRLRRRR